MDNTLLIWKYLRPLLTENQELTEYISKDNIYPLIAPSDTPYPFIIYKRDNLNPEYTKPLFGGWTNRIQVSISVYSDNYDECITIANLVRNILEGYYYSNNEITIHPIELSSTYESYSENGFLQNLIFNITAE